MAKKGIDISTHQGDIDLNALKSQVDFIIIRAGYGTNTIDKKFKRNADLCRELGIPVGFYWYSYALNTEQAKQEANSFINAITPYKDIMQYGAWFDMEDADGYKKKNGMPSNQTLRQMCYTFCETVENAGFYSGIYASQSWFNSQLATSDLDRFDKWVAQWPTLGGKQKGLSVVPESKSGVSLWQFTSQARLDGYNGNLDANYAYHEFPNPVKNTPEPEVKPEPTPEPTPEPKKSNEEMAEEVKAGKWGNYPERKTRLEAAGYDYQAIQDIVNASKKASNKITKGSKVQFTGTKSYSGINLASWTKNYIFNVIEVSGDRVVIGKGSAVTAAVNIKDCQKV